MEVSDDETRAGTVSAPDRDVLRRAGDASVLILTSLADGPKHGYGLIQDVKRFAGLQLGPGTLYGALERLEGLGLIEALPSDDRRQPYRMTPAGAEALRSHLDALDRISRTGRLRLSLGGI
jgi:DNA-binding PadR family transcriptional regulator